jgi:hypothetical protein
MGSPALLVRTKYRFDQLNSDRLNDHSALPLLYRTSIWGPTVNQRHPVFELTLISRTARQQITSLGRLLVVYVVSELTGTRQACVPIVTRIKNLLRATRRKSRGQGADTTKRAI